VNAEQALGDTGLDAGLRQLNALSPDSFQNLERQQKVTLAAAQVHDPCPFFDEADYPLVFRSEAYDSPRLRQSNLFG
jgi:hypothetical protein